jgi:hypothetical protein
MFSDIFYHNFFFLLAGIPWVGWNWKTVKNMLSGVYQTTILVIILVVFFQNQLSTITWIQIISYQDSRNTKT